MDDSSEELTVFFNPFFYSLMLKVDQKHLFGKEGTITNYLRTKANSFSVDSTNTLVNPAQITSSGSNINPRS